MKYPVAEKFKAPQGEGVHTGTPMAFIRLVGCSVGKEVCTHCDTDYLKMDESLGGGTFTPEDLVAWAKPYRRICITGGEPLDRDIRPLIRAAAAEGIVCHVETSGTRHPGWLDPIDQPRKPGVHAIATDLEAGRQRWDWTRLWIAVSPKPGCLERMAYHAADEIKWILGGLGDGPQGWWTIEDALRLAEMGKEVFVQPCNYKHDVDMGNLAEALDIVHEHPQLRVSVQMHKFMRTR